MRGRALAFEKQTFRYGENHVFGFRAPPAPLPRGKPQAFIEILQFRVSSGVTFLPRARARILAAALFSIKNLGFGAVCEGPFGQGLAAMCAGPRPFANFVRRGRGPHGPEGFPAYEFLGFLRSGCGAGYSGPPETILLPRPFAHFKPGRPCPRSLPSFGGSGKQ